MTSPTLAEWLARLERLHPNEIELGLDRIRAVADTLGLGAIAPKTISIAGTNGKGSTVAMLAACARSLGLTYACYTSPHLLFFNERIEINGSPIDDASLIQAFERIDRARGDIALTYFEFTTLAAFICIARADVDIAFLEIGLGGRLDAVNIIDADVGIVTSIAIDHEAWLGNSRDVIAIEKAGIARAGKPLLIGDASPPASLTPAGEQRGALIYCIGDDFSIETDALDNTKAVVRLCDGSELSLVSPLNLSAESMLLALQALALLDIDITAVDAQVLANTALQGRYSRQTLGEATLIFDVAHNPAAMQRLVERVQRDFPGKRIDIVLALMADKDYRAMVNTLATVVNGCWWLPALAIPRALSTAVLAEAIAAEAAGATITQAPLEQVFVGLDGDQVLLICGSFYTVAHGLERLQQWVANGE